MDRPASWRRHAIDLAAERPFRIGGAHIDPVSRDVQFGGGRERLQPQTLKVLIALVRRKGEVVSRAELADSCWDGRIIGDDVINHSISVLRDFAERAGGFTIETVPKSGYRLVETKVRAWLGARGWIAAALFVFVVLLAATTRWISQPREQGEPPIPTIAILPFDRPASDDMAREFAAETRLSLAHSLSEGGFPVRLLDNIPPDLGKTADLIISGRAQRDGALARAAVQIELPATRTIIFSQQFEASGADARILPERIGAQVGASLSWAFPLMVLDRRHASDPAMTAQLLKESTLVVQGGDPMRAFQISRELARKAPDSALAALGVAFNGAFVLGDFPRSQRADAVLVARHAADRAVALAPEFGDSYVPWCVLHSPVHFSQCEDRLRRALQIDADAPFVTFFLSSQLETVGRSREAVELARMALANDRYKLWKIARSVRTLEAVGLSGEADRLSSQGMRWWPNHPGLVVNRVIGLTERGDLAAIDRLHAQLGPKAFPQWMAVPRDLSAAAAGQDRARARRECVAPDPNSMEPAYCMLVLAQLGDLDAAYALADPLYPRLLGRNLAEEDQYWLDSMDKAQLGLLSSPAAAALRRDPRFLAIAERVGLLAYWRGGRLPDFCTVEHEPVCRNLLARD